MHDRDEDAGLMIWVQSKYFHCRTKRQMWTRRCGAGAFSMVGILIRLLGSAHGNSNYKSMLNYRIVHSVTLFASAFYYRRIQMCKRKHYCSNIGINPNFIVGVHQHLIDFIRSSILVLGATVDITLGTVVDVDDHVPSHHDDRWWPRWWKVIDGVGWWYWVLGSSWPWERGLKTLLENRWPVNILPDKGDQIFDLTAPLSSTTSKAWKQRKPQNSHGRCSLPLKVFKKAQIEQGALK